MPVRRKDEWDVVQLTKAYPDLYGIGEEKTSKF